MKIWINRAKAKELLNTCYVRNSFSGHPVTRAATLYDMVIVRCQKGKRPVARPALSMAVTKCAERHKLAEWERWFDILTVAAATKREIINCIDDNHQRDIMIAQLNLEEAGIDPETVPSKGHPEGSEA